VCVCVQVCCWNALSDEFQDAHIIAPITDKQTVIVRFERRDSYDSENSEEEEEEEQEVPVAYLRSLNGLEDLDQESEELLEDIIDDASSVHTIASGDDAKSIEERVDSNKPAQASSSYTYTHPVSLELDSDISHQKDEVVEDNELSELLDCVGCKKFYRVFYAVSGSSSAHELYLAGKDRIFSVESVSLAQRQTIWKLLKDQFGQSSSSISRSRSSTPYKMDKTTVSQNVSKGFLTFLRDESVPRVSESEDMDESRGMSVDNGRSDSREASMDRAALYGWQRMLEEKDKREEARRKFKVHDEEHKGLEETEEDRLEESGELVASFSTGKDRADSVVVSAWLLPVSVTVVLGDGDEIVGTPAETSSELVAATDNFIFRNIGNNELFFCSFFHIKQNNKEKRFLRFISSSFFLYS
jgi:hypothetical protein